MYKHILVTALLCLSPVAAYAEAPEVEVSLTDKQMLDASMTMLEAMQAGLKGDVAKQEDLRTNAEEIYTDILNREPEYPDALIGRAIIRNMMDTRSGSGDAERATKALTTLLQESPQDGVLFHKRATAYRAMGQYADARTDYEEAIRLTPENTRWPLDLQALMAEEEKATP